MARDIHAMNPPRSERRTFWKYAYARSSFVETAIFLETFFRERPSFGSEQLKVHTIAILTTYARPFKQKEPVRLDQSFVPAGYRTTHDWVIEHRDKSVAHRDLNAATAEWGFVNQLRIVADPAGITIHTLSAFMEDTLAHDLLALVCLLIPIMERELEPFIQTHFNPLPAPGEYTLNLNDDNPSVWLEPARSNI